MIKACFFDVDGTLISHTNQDNKIPESARVALKMLQEKGIQIVLATGRHMLEVEMMPGEAIPFDGYVVLNGHLCYDKQKKAIYKQSFCKEDQKDLILLFNEKRIPITLIQETCQYSNYIDDYMKKSLEHFSIPLPAISEYHGEEIYMASAYVKEKKILEEYFPNCSITQWNQFAYDVNTKGVSKMTGIKRYMEYFGLKKEEIMAFGDAENDIEMLRFAKIGVAMGNADERAKRVADYVTTHIDEDGIYNALKHYGII